MKIFESEAINILYRNSIELDNGYLDRNATIKHLRSSGYILTPQEEAEIKTALKKARMYYESSKNNGPNVCIEGRLYMAIEQYERLISILGIGGCGVF